MLNMCHSAHVSTGPAKTKWQRTCSYESDEYHYEFGVINLCPIVFLSYLLLRNKLECVI